MLPLAACKGPEEVTRVAAISVALTAVEQQKLTASDGGSSSRFGNAVSVSGNTVLVGAHVASTGVPNAGAAYVFVRTGGTWTQQAKLTASDEAASDNFGWSVALYGDTALVGAYGADDASDCVDAGCDSGAAYVFVRSSTTWMQQAKLTASDGAATDLFGRSVSLSGDTALVGADWSTGVGNTSGAAYVFVRSGSTWTEQQKLTASDAGPYDWFGSSVSLSGDTALIAALYDENTAGSAHVFVHSGSTWVEQQKVTPSDGTFNDYFGSSVSLSGDTALVGAAYDDDNGSNSGSAYVFVRSGSTWTEQSKLTASDAAADDHFGGRVSISGDTAFVGAADADPNGSNSGSAYVFVRSGSAWTEQHELTGSTESAGDSFGSSVAVSDDTAVAGAFFDDDKGSNSGSAYVFAFDVGVACSTETDCATGFCKDGVCCEQACTATCRRCDGALSAGLCTTVVNAEDADSCTAGYACDPSAECKLGAGADCASSDECVSAHCADALCCDTACDGACDVCAASLGASADGVCTIAPRGWPGDPACGPTPCTGMSGACGFNCAADDDCAGTHYCAFDGTCEPRKGLGQACSASAGVQCLSAGCRVCESGTCADGVCCKEACDQPCDVCTHALGAPTDGICAFANAGAVGDPACAPYLCTGESAACGDRCASDVDCALRAHCEPSGGTCAIDRDLGESCGRDAECEGGFCVDGRCCDSRCDGQCEACDVAEADGSYVGHCQAATGEPHGSRESCAGVGEACRGRCDGDTRTVCTFPDDATACGSAGCDGGREGVAHRGSCDGAGSCLVVERPCDTFACDDTACRTQCARDEHCALGYRCEADRCVPVADAICDGDHTVEHVDGASEDCSPYRCEPTGVCRAKCDSTADCVAGHRCTSSGECGESFASTAVVPNGCGCRVAVQGGDLPAGVWLLALALLAFRRMANSGRAA